MDSKFFHVIAEYDRARRVCGHGSNTAEEIALLEDFLNWQASKNEVAGNEFVSKREQFAIAVLPTLISEEVEERRRSTKYNWKKPHNMARDAYEWADTMISAGKEYEPR